MKNLVAVTVLLLGSSLSAAVLAGGQFSGVIQDVSSFRNIVISGKTYRYSTGTKVAVKGNDTENFPTSVLQKNMSVYYDLDYSEPGKPRVSKIQITGPSDAVETILNASD